MSRPSKARIFWLSYAALTAAMLGGFMAIAAGPVIETRLAPIRGPQSAAIIERTSARLCWAWTFVKLRIVASDNEDAFLDINGERSGVAATYDMDTGYPWGIRRFAVAPRSTPYTLHYCAPLPPAVRPSDTVRIRHVAFYPGWLGLWRLTVPFPDVVSEGAPPP